VNNQILGLPFSIPAHYSSNMSDSTGTTTV
jgi:hypothetical protein